MPLHHDRPGRRDGVHPHDGWDPAEEMTDADGHHAITIPSKERGSSMESFLLEFVVAPLIAFLIVTWFHRNDGKR